MHIVVIYSVGPYSTGEIQNIIFRPLVINNSLYLIYEEKIFEGKEPNCLVNKTYLSVSLKSILLTQLLKFRTFHRRKSSGRQNRGNKHRFFFHVNQVLQIAFKNFPEVIF